MKIVNIEKKNVHISRTSSGISMKLSEKMWLMITLKVTKKKGFTISLKNTFLTPPPHFSPVFLGLKWSLKLRLDIGTIFRCTIRNTDFYYNKWWKFYCKRIKALCNNKNKTSINIFQAQLKGKPTYIFLVFLFQWEFSKQFMVVFRCGGTSDMKYVLLLSPWGFVVRYILSPSSAVNMSKNFLLRVAPFDINTCTLSPIL